MNLEQVVEKVDRALPVAAGGADGGANRDGSLLALVGLPGSGKSLMARTLQGMTPSVVVSTDVARGYLGYVPNYSDSEIRFVYEVCYRVARKRLQEGQHVIFDGSNHATAHRIRLAKLAEECGVTVAFCYIFAAEEVVFERLGLRDISDRPEDMQSNARREVYRLMAGLQEPMTRPHLKLDSSTARPEELAAAARKYWLKGKRAS